MEMEDFILNIQYGCALLRAIEREDMKLLKYLMNAPEVERLTVGWNMPVSSYQQELWMKNYSNSSDCDCMRWMIEIENGTVLGMVILSAIDWKNRSAEIGIKINPNERNRIYGDVKDAYYAVLLYAFDELNLHRINSITLNSNVFSLKLSRGMGFVDEGVKRECIYKNGQWNDLIIGGLLQQEFIHYCDGTAPWQRKRLEKEKKSRMKGQENCSMSNLITEGRENTPNRNQDR